MRQYKFYPHQVYEQINCNKKSSIYFIGWSFRNWKTAAYLQLAKNWNNSTKLWQNILFNQHSQPLYDVMQKEIGNTEFVRGVHFEFIDLLKKNCTRCLLIFDNSCEDICNSKAFVDIATAGRYKGVSTIYIKNNLFHQSKLGKDVELQDTHNILFKSPCDVMQVTTLSTQLGLGSKLIDWYQYATSVHFGHLLSDLSLRTDDRLRYCTNNGSIPSKFYNPDRLKQSKNLVEENKICLLSKCSNPFPTNAKKNFLQSCPKKFIRFLCECVINLLKGNLQSMKRHHVAKLQSEVWLLSLKRTTF